MREILNLISLWLIPVLLCIILSFAMFKKIDAYNVFVSGAKDGFVVAVKILPYLIAIIVSTSMFRASGAIDYIANLFQAPLLHFNVPVDSLPLMLTRSLSGSATLGLLSDIVNANGPDSYASKLSAVIVGSSETTFYVLAVYFGAVGIKKIKYALIVGLMADIFGILMAIIVSGYFFL